MLALLESDCAHIILKHQTILKDNYTNHKSLRMHVHVLLLSNILVIILMHIINVHGINVHGRVTRKNTDHHHHHHTKVLQSKM